jgi:hypothetical protein
MVFGEFSALGYVPGYGAQSRLQARGRGAHVTRPGGHREKLPAGARGLIERNELQGHCARSDSIAIGEAC